MLTSLSTARRTSLIAGILLVGWAQSPAVAAEPPTPTPVVRLAFDAGVASDGALHLRGADDRRQLLVNACDAGGAERDATHHVRYSASPEGIVQISAAGVVTPVSDGSATLTATVDGDGKAELRVTVDQSGSSQPINFPNQIVPIFTKLGCNGGGCHGKSSGQNGFKLSLLGFEPTEDYEHIVKEGRGRRLFPAAPDRSLLLTKAVAAMPHGGGKRLEPDSDDYRLLIRWINQGMPYGTAADPTLTRIDVRPDRRVMARGGDQQLSVTAVYSDGATKDVTGGALFEPNDHDMAKVDGTGHVQMYDQPGDVAVMVRYQGKVAVYRATAPLGAPAEAMKFPAARNFVDEQVFQKLREMGMPPSAVCDDATFLRRVTIDLAGRLPKPEETRAFLADSASDKRDKWIDRLLNSADYADNFANKWSALLRNKRENGDQSAGTFLFHGWIRDSLLANKPYDQFARDILTASGDLEDDPPVAWYRQARDAKAELEDVAQLFMGMRLQCAQCHHHPFEKWSQQDYYGLAAFFSRVGRRPGARPGEEAIFHRRGEASASNPKNKQNVKPTGLGATTGAISPDDDPRQALANWLTSRDNPFFARSLVNRYWKHFFGRGVVDPEDDMRDTNPPTNPALLDVLTQRFIESGFDLKELVRSICRSSTYQLASEPNAYNATDRQNFSRHYPRRMTAEAMLDSVNDLLGVRGGFNGLPADTRAVQLPDNSFNGQSYFLTVFGRPEASSACECERSQDASLAQSLHLLNAKDIQQKLTAADGRAAKLAADKGQSDEQKIQELYLLAFSRPATAEELSAATRYLSDHADPKNAAAPAKSAYEDLIWALINTKEFAFNH